MEYEKIKQLMDDMGNSKLSEINIDFPDGTKISMKKDEKQEKSINKISELIVDNDNSSKIEEITQVQERTGNIVKSPMVGTFYSKPSPTSDSYVEIGKKVKKGDTLCIIEAMKLMNEIESEYSGIIKEILIEDGSPVEYGTELFVIE
jgi:acetyl-CoA carboxylase biotin carboxyl carrier protein